MAIDYTTTELVAGLKRRGKIPTNQNLYQESDFIKILSSELQDEIVPSIMSVREKYFLAYQDILIESGTVLYDIPTRAIGGKLDDVLIVDSNGKLVADLPRLDSEGNNATNQMDYVQRYGFLLEDYQIKLYPDESSWVGNYVRMWYFRRPNKLIPTTSAGKILSIDTGTKVVTLDNAPSSWATSTLFDVIGGKPPFQSRQDNQTITAIAGFDLTFTSLPNGMVVGDYIAEAEESPIPQIPYDAFGWLEQRGAVKSIEGVGEGAELKASNDMADRLELKFFKKIAPRVDEAAKKIISRKGIFRSARRFTWPR